MTHLKLAEEQESCENLDFEKQLGAFQGVDAYSNLDDSYFSGEKHFVDGVYSGYKYQCVEYARRFLLHTRGCIFGEVFRASEIFDKTIVVDVQTGNEFQLDGHVNGVSQSKPESGDILIYPFHQELLPVGHVAIVSTVGDDWVGIAEQNQSSKPWLGRCYGRIVPLERKVDGSWYMKETDPEIVDCKGWMRAPSAPIRDHSSRFDVLPQFRAPLPEMKMSRLRAKRPSIEQLAGERSGWIVPQFPLSLPSERALFSFYEKIDKRNLIDNFLSIYYPNEDSGVAALGTSNAIFRAVIHGLELMFVNSDKVCESYGIPRELMNCLRGSLERSQQGHRSICSTFTVGFLDYHPTAFGVSLDSLSHFTEGSTLQQLLPQLNGRVRGWTQGIERDKVKPGSFLSGHTLYFVDCGADLLGDDSVYQAERLHTLHLYSLLSNKSELSVELISLEELEYPEAGSVAVKGRAIKFIHKIGPWIKLFQAAKDSQAVARLFIQSVANSEVEVFPPLCFAPTFHEKFYGDLVRVLELQVAHSSIAAEQLKVLLPALSVGSVVTDIHGVFVRSRMTPFAESSIDKKPLLLVIRPLFFCGYWSTALVLESKEGQSSWQPASMRWIINEGPETDTDNQVEESW